jgi:hypothetical protein
VKLTAKTAGLFVILALAGMLAGSLFWEVIERIVRLVPAFSSFTLTVAEPLRLIDLYVIAISLRANPGTFLGLVAGIVLFVTV